MTIDSWIADGAVAHPDKLALECGETRYSYAGMARAVERRAAGLTGVGIKRGDRVAWYGMNNAEVFVLLFACARLGAILVPLNWRLAEAEVAAIVADCAPKLVIHDSHFADRALGLEGVRLAHAADKLPQATVPEGEPASTDDPLLIVYTSGSTGVPKGAVLTQKALVANAAMSVEAHGLRTEDTVLNVLPLFHVGGLNILPTPAFSIGASVVLHPKFDPALCCADLGRVQAAIVVPTVIQAIMACDAWATADLSALRVLSIGSTDVPISIMEAVHARGVPMIQIYGATETAPLAIYQNVAEAFDTAGSLGREGSRCAIRLVGLDGVDVAQGQPGQVLVRGDNVLTGYWNNSALTAELLKDGWFATGDVARQDEAGLYWFVDRIKNVIISGGENIYPAELERVLREHPTIEEVAVVGRPDPKWGEAPVAVVVARKELTIADVTDTLKGRVARYKWPADIVRVDQLPRNAMGKVVAGEVRKIVEASQKSA